MSITHGWPPQFYNGKHWVHVKDEPKPSQVIVSKAHKQMLVVLSDQVKIFFPDAPVLSWDNIEYAVIAHTPDNVIQLRKCLNIEAPAPILSYYDWEGGTPFSTQMTTAALTTSHYRAYVLSDMGTGKTKAALWSWRYLNRIGAAGKMLVVAPLSTLSFTWGREAFATLPGVKTVVLGGSGMVKDKRLRLLADKQAQIFVINHEGVSVIAKELAARDDIDTLVLDELAVYRNHGSLRSRQMRAFAQRFKWVWGMSGRPMPNAPTDVWAQCRILTPQTIPQFFTHAQTQLMTRINQFKWVPKRTAIETAYSWMQPNVRFALDDVVELPPFVSRVIDIELTPQQAQAYRKLSNDMVALINEKKITAANAGVAMGKLLQVSAGYVYTKNPDYVTLDSSTRKDAFRELIEEAPGKLLVFAPWRHLIDNLSWLLSEPGESVEHAVIHGDIRNREEIFHDFQSTDRYRVLLCHPECVHHGLTLTAASTIIWYSPVASLEVYEQANARIRRPTQLRKQQFLHLQSTAVERRIYSLLRNKQKTQDEFLAMIRDATA